MMEATALRRTAAHAVLDVLADEGVTEVFGYPGGAIMPLYDALFHERRITHILTRHEAAAAFAAGGYARATGKVGVCIATSGPGATNLVTGILDASMDSVPMVAITGQVRSALIGTDAFQEADMTAIAQPITKRAILVRAPGEIVSAMREAFRLARSGRPGPVLVDITSDVLKARFEETRPHAGVTVRVSPTPPDRRTANGDALERAAALLETAQAPLVIAGGGVRIAEAVDAYRTFVATLRAPHASTINALGCAQLGDPAFLGMLGMHGWKAANRAVNAADVIVALGMRFDDRVTGRLDRFAPQAKIIHVDVDATEIGKLVPVAVGIHADVRETLVALNRRLADSAMPSRDAWMSRVAAFGAPLPTDRRSGALTGTDVIDGLVVRAADAIVATDVGQHQMWTAQRVRPSDPRAFLTSAGLGSMGFGLPAAIGAQIAYPERRVIAVVGDGGFQMSLAELATLGRYDLPVKIVLIDNRNLGMVRQWQELFYERRYSATDLYDNPSFTALAQAYGIGAARCDRPESLGDALDELLSAPGPRLLHCECYPAENVWPMIPAGGAIDEALEAAPA